MDQLQFSTANVVREIDNVLAQLNDLATSSDVRRAEFYQHLLLQTTRLLDADAAAIWWNGPGNTVHLARHLHLDRVLPNRDAYQAEAERVALVPSTGVADLGSGSGSVLTAPVQIGGQRRGAIAMYQRQELSDPIRAGQLRFLTATAEILAEFEARIQRQHAAGAATRAQALEQLVLSVHADGSLTEVAYRIAHDGRVFVGCDRITVLVRRGRRYETLACSGTTTPQRRSDLIRSLEALVAAVSRTGSPLIVPAALDEFLPPQITEPLDAYLDQSAVRSLVIVPLVDHDADRPFAAIVMECFDEVDGPELLRSANTLCEHAAVSLRRAIRWGQFPANAILAATRPLQQLINRRYLPHGVIAVASLAIVITCLALIPIDFRVTSTGTLQPTNRRYVFANHDGFVDSLVVKHGDRVQEGQVVVELASPDLELEIKRVLGELHTQQQDLASIAAERLQLHAVDRATEQRASQLSANEMTAREKIKSLEAQLRLLTADNDRLTHRSPIGGTVLDWDLTNRLQSRRIRRGQRLLEIAQLDGPWHLELAVPDNRAGHVLNALAKDDHGLLVRFVLEDQPSQRYEGVIRNVARATQLIDGSPSVVMEVTFEHDQRKAFRPNGTAVAKIHCGQRSILFVWLHEFYEELRRRFF